MQLRNRNLQIPNSLRFYQAQTKWSAQGGSFSSIVDQVIAHRQRNAWLRLSTDRAQVENEVDQYNAALCQQMGWLEYVIGGDPPVPPIQPLPNLASRLVAVGQGGEVLVEWIASGAEAVPVELANARAKTCTNIDGQGKRCPMNEAGDLLRFFTVPASEAIRKALNARREMKLQTPYDQELNICSACSCPLRLKIHMPLERIKQKLKPEQIARLHANCWITKEA